MYKRAFLAVQYQTENVTGVVSGMVEVPWPPDEDDLQHAANQVVFVKAVKFRSRVVISEATIISLAWCSEVRE